MSYLSDHWRGRLDLLQSFWINFVLLRLILIAGERVIQPLSTTPETLAFAGLAYFLICQLLVLPWQLVGLVRATNAHVKSYGSMASVLGIYLGVGVGLAFVFSSSFTTFQNLYIYEAESQAWQEMGEAEPLAYSIVLSDRKDRVHLEGVLDPGVTRDLRALLAEQPQVTILELSSKGGNVFEARGIASLVQEQGLDTHVEGLCLSACTIPFVAGEGRSLGAAGKIGFHRYRLEANLPSSFIDPETEQQKDRQFYRAQGVAESFLERVFEAAHDQIWLPNQQVLLAAGVIHRLVPVSSTHGGEE